MQITILAVLFLIYNMSGPESRDRSLSTPDFPEDPPFLEVDASWVDSVMDGLSLEERIAQMIMVQAYSNMGETHKKNITT